MPFRPIQWARKSLAGRQIEADGSRLVNLYAVQLSEPEVAKVPVMLYGAPGLERWTPTDSSKALAAANALNVHWLLEVNSVIYGHHLFGLANQSVFFDLEITDPENPPDIAAADTHQFATEPEDAVSDGEKRKMVTDGRRVMWVSKNEVYTWDLGRTVTRGGKEIREPGFITIAAPAVPDLSTLEDLSEQDWVSCEWIDGYFMLAARSGIFYHSANDATTFEQLDFAEAGSNPDQIVGIEALNRRVYIIGTRSIESWFNSGRADFAFDRDNSATLNIGCSSEHSIVRDEASITFVGHDGIVYALAGRIGRISNESVEYDIARSDIKKTRAYGYTEEGHRFYVMTLYMDGSYSKTWAFDFTTGVWHERTVNDILCSTRFNHTDNLVGRAGKGHIFSQSLNTAVIEDDSVSGPDAKIEREAVSPVLFANNQRVNLRSFRVDLSWDPDDEIFDRMTNEPNTEAGNKLRNNRFNSYKIKIDWSDDGGRTFFPQDRKPIARNILKYVHEDYTGAAQNPTNPITTFRLGQFRKGRNMRIRFDVPFRVDVLGAYSETDVWPD